MKSEKIDTRALLNGRPGDANYTDPKKRLDERAKVLDYWSSDLLDPVRDGFLAPPPWRLLLDPTSWSDVDRADVHDHVRAAIRDHGAWPSLDGLRRRFGRVSNHRSAAENPAQSALI